MATIQTVQEAVGEWPMSPPIDAILATRRTPRTWACAQAVRHPKARRDWTETSSSHVSAVQIPGLSDDLTTPPCGGTMNRHARRQQQRSNKGSVGSKATLAKDRGP